METSHGAQSDRQRPCLLEFHESCRVHTLESKTHLLDLRFVWSRSRRRTSEGAYSDTRVPVTPTRTTTSLHRGRPDDLTPGPKEVDNRSPAGVEDRHTGVSHLERSRVGRSTSGLEKSRLGDSLGRDATTSLRSARPRP